MDNELPKESKEEEGNVPDSTEGDEFVKRIQGYAIIPEPLRPKQVSLFKERLEALCNEFLDMDYDEELEEEARQIEIRKEKHARALSGLKRKSIVDYFKRK